MLERIEVIQGVGLLHDVNGSPRKLQKSTLVYADNGRGKSTLSTILRSVGSNDSTLITQRKTIDGTLAPKVILQFSNGHKVNFTGTWSEGRPEFLVYDSDFVDKNVHSGGAVTTVHRKNLLQFALGEKAVAARKAEEKATDDSRTASELVQQLIKQLIGHHTGISLEQFEILKNDLDADVQIQDLEKRIVAARNSVSLLKRAAPSPIPIPDIQLGRFFDIFNTTVESIQEDSETIVRGHVKLLGNPGAEAWLSKGQEYSQGDLCPYCNQSTNGIDLVRAYKTHFSAKYAELKSRVSNLRNRLFETINESIINDFTQKTAASASSANAWLDQVLAPDIGFDAEAARTLLKKLQATLLTFVDAKQASPTSLAGTTAEHEALSGLWIEIVNLMNATNSSISEAKRIIDEYRKTLAAEDVQALLNQQQRLALSKKRHDPLVISLFANLAAARLASATAERAKEASRVALDAIMKQVLKDYQKAINDLLIKFGAAFQIKSMDANFRGGSPRSEYGLELRGKSIPLEGGPPSFATALSDGDKRTLGFAFFVATTLSDPNLSNRIIAIDDPMCSLDLNRKQHTRRVIKDLNDHSRQIIILAHDIYFIRDIRDDLIGAGPNNITTFQIRHGSKGYSTFADIDVDAECQSPYFRHHCLLTEFVNSGVGDPRHVAKAIRPLLEGYLHRRFPGILPKSLLFGQVVGQIRVATASSPLNHAQCITAELDEINSYAGQFHHDTNPGNADTIQINSTELITYATRSLNLIYKGAI